MIAEGDITGLLILFFILTWHNGNTDPFYIPADPLSLLIAHG